MRLHWYSACCLRNGIKPTDGDPKVKTRRFNVAPLALVALSLLSAGPAAHASYALTAASSHWKTADEADAFLQTQVCRAFTGTSNSAEPVELSMAYPKDARILPMVALKTKLAPASIAVKVTNTEFEHLFLLQAGATNEDKNLYWYAPVNFARFEAMVRERNYLDFVLDPKGAKTPVRVSLVGSANALDAVKKCLKATAVPHDFFKLLNAAKDNLTPDLGDRSPLFLFKTVQQALDSFLAGRGIQSELAKLRAAAKPLLDKEKAAFAAVKTATANFTAAKTKLEDARAKEADLTSRLSFAKAELARLQAEKPIAEADLAKKKGIYLPLKTQMAPYEKAIVDAAAAVKSIESDISSKETLIARNTRRIPELESESASLRRQIPGLESRVRSTRSEFDDADREYRNYDTRREYERELDRDTWYSWAKRDLETAKREQDDAKRRTWDAQRRMQDAKSALEGCQRSTPPQDCSSQNSAYQSAESEWRSAWMNESSADSKVRSAESKVRDIEDDVKRKVDRISDDLRRKRDSAESDYDSARNALTNAENRIAEIRSAIPVLRRQIETARAALPGLKEKLAAAEATQASAVAARDAFSRQIGFEEAKQAYLDADKVVKDTLAGIAARTKEIPVLTKELAATTKAIPGLEKTFTATETALKAAEAKLAPIQEQLKPFRASEAEVIARLAAEEAVFKDKRAAYQDLVKLLTQ